MGEEGEKEKKEETLTWRTTYSSNDFLRPLIEGHTIPTPITKESFEPLTITINHNIRQATEEEIRRGEKARKRQMKIYEPQVLRMLELHTRPGIDPQPFLSTEEIARLIKPDNDWSFESLVYSICDGLEDRGILKSRSFYDDQGESARIWWLKK